VFILWEAGPGLGCLLVNRIRHGGTGRRKWLEAYCGGLAWGADLAAFAMKSFSTVWSSGFTAAMRFWIITVDCFSKTGVFLS
jgi:hypothetical protein